MTPRQYAEYQRQADVIEQHSKWKNKQMKQTAVDWLIEQFSKKGYIGLQDELQAKEMEKEQIMEAWGAGVVAKHKSYSLEYYNKTYGSKGIKPLTEGSMKTAFGKNNPTVDIKQTAPPPSPKVYEISDEEIEKTGKLSAVKYLADAILSQRYNKDIFDLHDIIQNAFLIENELLEGISDEEIEKGLCGKHYDPNNDVHYNLVEGAKWYREQLNKNR